MNTKGKCRVIRYRRMKKRTKSGKAAAAVVLSFVLFALSLFFFRLPPVKHQVIAAEADHSVLMEGFATADGTDHGQGSAEEKTETEPGDENKVVSAPIVKERKDTVIVLDPGHGGEDEGCSEGDILEKDINLEIALLCQTKLREMGYQVRLTRSIDWSVSLEKRVETANRQNADLYVSIHQNASEKKKSEVKGVEVWYNADKAQDGSKRLAQLMEKEILIYTKAKEREVVEDSLLYVTRNTEMPSCLVETGFLSNPEERKLLVTEEYQTQIAKGIASAVELYFEPKTMYLTFDDGPRAGYTEAVLDILKERGIKATFFLVGESVEKNPELARRIADEGHTIGIHCYRHEYGELYRSAESYLEDFERARRVIADATGVEPVCFRFPGGSINSHNKKVYREIVAKMTDAGYVYYDWNASLEDATKHNEPEILLKNARESTLGRKRVILLAHDSVYNTTITLSDILEEFPEYRFLPLTPDVEPIQF